LTKDGFIAEHCIRLSLSPICRTFATTMPQLVSKREMQAEE
jgi:hypothetical protein